jgi:hypothetical protein
MTLNLRSGSGHALLSTLTVHAEETSSSRMAVEMTFHCLNLDNKDTFSLSVWITFFVVIRWKTSNS